MKIGLFSFSGRHHGIARESEAGIQLAHLQLHAKGLFSQMIRQLCLNRFHKHFGQTGFEFGAAAGPNPDLDIDKAIGTSFIADQRMITATQKRADGPNWKAPRPHHRPMQDLGQIGQIELALKAPAIFNGNLRHSSPHEPNWHWRNQL